MKFHHHQKRILGLLLGLSLAAPGHAAMMDVHLALPDVRIMAADQALTDGQRETLQIAVAGLHRHVLAHLAEHLPGLRLYDRSEPFMLQLQREKAFSHAEGFYQVNPVNLLLSTEVQLQADNTIAIFTHVSHLQKQHTLLVVPHLQVSQAVFISSAFQKDYAQQVETALLAHSQKKLQAARDFWAQRQADLALQTYQEAVFTPAEAYQGLALIFDQQQNWQQLLDNLQEALRHAPHNLTLHSQQAKALWGLNRFAEAAAVYQHLQQQAPHNPEFQIYEGVCLMQAGEHAAAEATFTALLEREPEHLAALFQRGTARLLKQPELYLPALADFEQFTLLAPADHPDLAKAWFNQALILAELAKPAEARVALNRALQLDPQNGLFYFVRAQDPEANGHERQHNLRSGCAWGHVEACQALARQNPAASNDFWSDWSNFFSQRLN